MLWSPMRKDGSRDLQPKLGERGVGGGIVLEPSLQ